MILRAQIYSFPAVEKRLSVDQKLPKLIKTGMCGDIFTEADKSDRLEENLKELSRKELKICLISCTWYPLKKEVERSGKDVQKTG